MTKDQTACEYGAMVFFGSFFVQITFFFTKEQTACEYGATMQRNSFSKVSAPPYNITIENTSQPGGSTEEWFRLVGFVFRVQGLCQAA